MMNSVDGMRREVCDLFRRGLGWEDVAVVLKIRPDAVRAYMHYWAARYYR